MQLFSSKALWCLGIVMNIHLPSRNQSFEAVLYPQTKGAGSIVVASMDRAYLYTAMMLPTTYTGMEHHLQEHESRPLTLRIQLSHSLACKNRERNG